jgi:hypothetical protein
MPRQEELAVFWRRRRGLDPHEYLRDVPARITESTNWQVAELTPEKNQSLNKLA